MILNLDKWSSDAVAAIDSQGQQLTYGELRDFAVQAGRLMPTRSLFFLLVENNVGGVAWTISNICAGNVPLILNAHLDEALYKSLYELYQPPFVCVPEGMADKFDYETVGTLYGYTLMKTGNEACPMNKELSRLLPPLSQACHSLGYNETRTILLRQDDDRRLTRSERCN